MKCGDCLTTLVHKDGYYECPNCGWTIADDEIEDFDLEDYRSQHAFHALPGGGADMPDCCTACGGDYPNCADSCSMFDD